MSGNRFSVAVGRPRGQLLACWPLSPAFYGGLQAVLMHDNGCELTPPGCFNQNLVSQTPHAFHTTCVLDPNNGEPRYTIHRPWQSVHGR